MKKCFSLLMCIVLLCALLPVTASASVSEVMVVCNCESWVSLRKTPATNASRIIKVYRGELVSNCSQSTDGFIYCEVGGKSGYIDGKYLGTTPLTAADGILRNQMVYKCDEWVSLRAEPDTSSARLSKVPLHAVVTSCRTEGNANFIHCSYNGITGWISRQYLMNADYDMLSDLNRDYEPVAFNMQVVNCKEWVSLRDMPTTQAKRLAKVPLGAVVDDCEQVTGEFIRCNFEGKTGYIHVDYLSAVEHETDDSWDDEGDEDSDWYTKANTGFNELSAFPSPEELLSVGFPSLDESVRGYRVIARKAELFEADIEQLMAVCYDASGRAIWSVMAENDGLTELSGVEAFLGGTAEKPLLIIFTTDQGLRAYQVGPWQDVEWTLDNHSQLMVGGSICVAVDPDGTAYMCGYYGQAPVAVSADGKVLWHAENKNESIIWPYRITTDEEGIHVNYDSYFNATNMQYMLTFDRNGQLLSTTLVEEDEPEYEED